MALGMQMHNITTLQILIYECWLYYFPSCQFVLVLLQIKQKVLLQHKWELVCACMVLHKPITHKLPQFLFLTKNQELIQ